MPVSATSSSGLRTATPVMTAAPFQERAPQDWWRSPMVITVGLGTAVILLGILFWPNTSNQGGTAASEPARSAPAAVPAGTAPAAETPAAKAAAPISPSAPSPVAPGAVRVELLASEPTWVAIRGADGATQMSALIEPGNSRSVDIREPAILRAGNAGGLTIRANGKSLGPVGPHGAVRDVEFKNGEFKPVPIK